MQRSIILYFIKIRETYLGCVINIKDWIELL